VRPATPYRREKGKSKKMENNRGGLWIYASIDPRDLDLLAGGHTVHSSIRRVNARYSSTSAPFSQRLLNVEGVLVPTLLPR
jgi:hypothetical protein